MLSMPLLYKESWWRESTKPPNWKAFNLYLCVDGGFGRGDGAAGIGLVLYSWPHWHQGTIAPRAPQKENNNFVVKNPKENLSFEGVLRT